MTIEEKAEEYRSDIFGTPFGKDIEMAFIEGAKWMKDSVEEWIENYLLYGGGSFAVWEEGGRDDFEKFLMEE